MPVSSVSSSSGSYGSASGHPVLRQGASGSAVSELQRLLKSKGYPVAVDGSFGPKTAAAVRAFQSAKGLGTDGIVGPKTWAALGGSSAAAAQPAPTTGTPTLKVGSKGASVSELQRLLRNKGYNVAVDGSFGAGTKSAVIKFQRANGLSADGVVGPKTWSALRSSGSSAPDQSTPSGAKTVKGYKNGSPVNVQVAPVGNGEYMNVKCAQAYKNMLAAAKKAGISLSTTDGFRTYAEQKALYDRYGSPRAARPGYSNHQMGLSADIGGVGSYNTRAYRWLKANAGQYGFVNDVSGEYWHWTYKK